MNNNLIKAIILSLFFAGPASANLIYIDQIGDNLDLDIVQDGQDNSIGSSSADAVFNGDNMNFSITQTGSYNVIAAIINGDTYTGTWDITGDTNDIALLCDSANSNSSCGTVTANITIDGDSQDVDLSFGETADASNLIANITIDGDGNIVAMTVDGTSVVATLTIDNTVLSGTDGTANTFTVGISGDGDVDGHTYIHDHTGGGAVVNVTQSGTNDNLINMTTSGDSATIDISQTD
jgi:hypothetical protein